MSTAGHVKAGLGGVQGRSGAKQAKGRAGRGPSRAGQGSCVVWTVLDVDDNNSAEQAEHGRA